MIENSFGTIPVKIENNVPYVFLIQQKNGEHWGFPKGHKEEAETPKLTATRELKEETDLSIKRFIKSDPFIETYNCIKNGNTIHKTVAYYLIEAEGEPLLDPNEVIQGDWFSLDKAYERLTFLQSKKLLTEAQKYIS